MFTPTHKTVELTQNVFHLRGLTRQNSFVFCHLMVETSVQVFRKKIVHSLYQSSQKVKKKTIYDKYYQDQQFLSNRYDIRNNNISIKI